MKKMSANRPNKGSQIGTCVRIVIVCQLVVIAVIVASVAPSRRNVSPELSPPPPLLSQQQLNHLETNAIANIYNLKLKAKTYPSPIINASDSGINLRPYSRSVDPSSEKISLRDHHKQFHNEERSNHMMNTNPLAQSSSSSSLRGDIEVPKYLPPPPSIMRQYNQQQHDNSKLLHENMISQQESELKLPLDLSEDYICSKYPKICQCSPLEPKIILYNRIPKAGSGSMNVFLGEAKKRISFDLCLSKMYHDRLLEGRKAEDYAHNPIYASGCNGGHTPKSILSRHVFYMNLSEHSKYQPSNEEGETSPVVLAAGESVKKRRRQSRSNAYRPQDPSRMVYMNVIREPVGRIISRYYYERDARGTFSHDSTLDECMGPNGQCKFQRWKGSKNGFQRYSQFMDECSTNYLSRWFCGMDQVCHNDFSNKYILQKAMETIGNGYAFVGLTSEMKLNFKILQKLFPTYFADESIPIDICNKCKQEGSPDTPKLPPAPKPSQDNTERIASINALDLELYKFAEACFWLKAKACGVLET